MVIVVVIGQVEDFENGNQQLVTNGSFHSANLLYSVILKLSCSMLRAL